MTAIIDYGAGNLQSVKKALDFIGAENTITSSADEILRADRVILPGVGSFGDAMACMEKSGLVPAVKQAALSGKPFLGICLGLHLLFEGSEESGGIAGLGIFKGSIKKFPADDGVKIPHIGWNSLKVTQCGGIFASLPEEPYAYFVHSYYLKTQEESLSAAKTVYGSTEFDCAIEQGKLCAVQFHPEKSGKTGLLMLKNFVGEE